MMQYLEHLISLIKYLFMISYILQTQVKLNKILL